MDFILRHKSEKGFKLDASNISSLLSGEGFPKFSNCPDIGVYETPADYLSDLTGFEIALHEIAYAIFWYCEKNCVEIDFVSLLTWTYEPADKPNAEKKPLKKINRKHRVHEQSKIRGKDKKKHPDVSALKKIKLFSDWIYVCEADKKFHNRKIRLHPATFLRKNYNKPMTLDGLIELIQSYGFAITKPELRKWMNSFHIQRRSALEAMHLSHLSKTAKKKHAAKKK